MLGYAHAPAAPVDAVSPEDIHRAEELAGERYTAARRRYTHLYVEARSQARPDAAMARELKEASALAIEMAAALREIQDGDLTAIRASLEASPVTDEEKALTTDRFTIADLHAAANPAHTWSWSA